MSTYRQTRWPRKSFVIEASLPVFRQVGSGDDLQSAVLGASGVESPQDPRGAVGGRARRAGDDVVDPFAARAVGGECRSPLVPGGTPGVDQTAEDDVELEVLGPHLPDAAGIEPLDSPGVSMWLWM